MHILTDPSQIFLIRLSFEWNFWNAPVTLVRTPYFPLHLHPAVWQQNWHRRESVLGTERLNVILWSLLCVCTCVRAWVHVHTRNEIKWQYGGDNSIKSIKRYVNAMNSSKVEHKLFWHTLFVLTPFISFMPTFHKVSFLESSKYTCLKWISPTHH